MQAAQRLYPGCFSVAPPSGAGADSTVYSRTRHYMASPTAAAASFFAGGAIDESAAIFQQARAAEAAALVQAGPGAPNPSQWQFPVSSTAAFRGMDVKDVKYMPGATTTVLLPADVLSYHNSHLQGGGGTNGGGGQLPPAISTHNNNGGLDTSFSSFSTQLAEAAAAGTCMPTSMDHHHQQMAAAAAMQHYHHPSAAAAAQHFHSQYGGMVGHHHHHAHFGGGMSSNDSTSSSSPPMPPPRYPANLPLVAAAATGEPDTDPRELERFAEHFKQRRIKLGVTQADVGHALAHLKMPGVGSLSQSTICRFESLTLSHNNMVALKPILQSWLEKAEDAVKAKNALADAGGVIGGGGGGSLGGGVGAFDDFDSQGILPNTEKKRKRTSIAAPEKRSLEAYFALQPRPSGEKIAAIAEKLDLKKNVVRVWFCNQRQKQKRCRNQSNGRMPTSQKGGNLNGYFGGD